MIVITAMLVVTLDQLSKYFFSQLLPLNKSIPILKNCFHITLIHNTGIAFGMLKDSSRLILIVTVIGLGLIMYSLRKDLSVLGRGVNSQSLRMRKTAAGFIIGGAIGNMIDRLRLGYVIDFLDFRVWPVFNLADSFITIGAVILFWSLFLKSKTSQG